MDGHTLATCHIAADGIGRRRAAAARQLGQQRFHAHHQHAALGGAGALEVDAFVFSRRGRSRAQQQLDVAQRELVLAHHLEQRIGALESQLRSQVVELDGRAALTLQQLFHQLAPAGDGGLHRLGVEPGPHLGLAARAADVAQLGIQPIERWPALLGGHHLHGLAVGQRGVQRHHHAVDPGATAAVAQVGVQHVGKVDRCGARAQFDHRGLGREDVDAVLERRAGQARIATSLAGEVPLPGQQLAQHRLACLGHPFLELACGQHPGIALGAGLLVGPMGGHAMLGMLMHGCGADLHFHCQAGAGRAVGLVEQHHGVQALVAVGLGPGDVVVVFARHRAVAFMHPRQGRVAGRHVGHDHAQRAQVEHPVQRQALALHLLPDAVEVLGPALHLGADAGSGQLGLQLATRGLDAGLALQALLRQGLGQALVIGRQQEAEGQVLHLPLDLPDAQPVGERCEHLLAFLRQQWRARRPGGGMPAQRLQARGQTQQHHPQIA